MERKIEYCGWVKLKNCSFPVHRWSEKPFLGGNFGKSLSFGLVFIQTFYTFSKEATIKGDAKISQI